jgi:hypothetical protein
MKRSTRIWLSAGGLVLILVLLGGGYWLWRYTNMSRFRRALPASATHVKEKYVDLTPDYTLYLSARMGRKDYEKYIRRIDLQPPQKGSSAPSWVAWHQGPQAPAWWTSSPARRAVAYKRKGDVFTLSGYEKGTMYLISWSQ